MKHTFMEQWALRKAALSALVAAFGIRAKADDAEAEVQRLMSQQQTILGRSQAVIATADQEGRQLSETERETIRLNTGTIEFLQAKIDRLEADMSTPQPRQVTADALYTGPANQRRVAHPGVSRGTPVIDAAIPGRGRYANLFGSPPAGGAGFKSLGEFVQAVGARDSQRLQNAGSGMQEGVGVDGGFLVPAAFTAELLDASFDQEVIRPRARVIPLLGSSLSAPVFANADRTKGPAGLIGFWAGEGDPLTKQKAATRLLNFRAKKLTILLPLTNELMFDAPAEADAYIREAMAGAVASYLDRAFYFGSGAGQPLGILNGTALVTVSKEAGQVANTIVFENISKMIARLLPGSFGRAVWLVHPATLPALMQLRINIRNVAGTENVGGTVAPIQVAADGSMTLMTRPVIVTDLASPLSSLGDIMLADFSGYAIAMQPQIRFRVSEEFGFDRDETYFRVTARVDAQTILPSVVTPRAGADTLSQFVTLEAR
jgi:HK97 family phage major capsid protein